MKRFSKIASLALLVVAMIFTLAGCKSPKQVGGDIVVTVPEVEAPAEEAKEEAPAVEPAPIVEEETPVEIEAQVPVTYKPVSKKYSLAGYELTVVAEKGRAVISYPSIITEEDINTAAQAAVVAYGKDYMLSDVLYSVDAENHVLTLSYPETWGFAEYVLAEQLIASELPGYVDAVYGFAMPVEVLESEPFVVEISVYGYDATITIGDGKAIFEYPSFLTNDEIKAAASVAYEAYSAYLEGTALKIVEPGKSVLTFPAGYSQEDLAYAAEVLAEAVPSYIMSVVASMEAPVEEVKEEVKEEVVEAQLYEREFNLFGYTAYILAYENQVAIYYPDFITNAEIRVAAEAAYAAYSDYLKGSTLSIDNGFALLTLAYNLGEDDFNFAADLLEGEVNAYVQAMYAQATTEEPAEVEEVAVVAQAPAEEAPAAKEEETPVVEEEPAKTEETKTEEVKKEEPAKQEEKKEEKKEEAPATQPSTQSTTTSTQATATAEPAKKKSSAGVVILIIVLVLVAAAAVYVFLKKKKN